MKRSHLRHPVNPRHTLCGRLIPDHNGRELKIARNIRATTCALCLRTKVPAGAVLADASTVDRRLTMIEASLAALVRNAPPPQKPPPAPVIHFTPNGAAAPICGQVGARESHRTLCQLPGVNCPACLTAIKSTSTELDKRQAAN